MTVRRSIRDTTLNFFFSSRRRHTIWPRDWSSDVCSSDLERSNAKPLAEPLSQILGETCSAGGEQIHILGHALGIAVCVDGVGTEQDRIRTIGQELHDFPKDRGEGNLFVGHEFSERQGSICQEHQSSLTIPRVSTSWAPLQPPAVVMGAVGDCAR